MLPPITFIGGESKELPLRDIIRRLEVKMKTSEDDQEEKLRRFSFSSSSSLGCLLSNDRSRIYVHKQL